METKAHHLLTGLFVLGLVLLGFVFVHWLKNDTGGPRLAYAIHFEGSVAGLTQASAVTFNGIPVGRVESFRLLPEDARKVEVVVRVSVDAPVRATSRATLVGGGLTGAASVQLSPGAMDSPLTKGSDARPYPLIKADASMSRPLMDAAPEVIANANAVFTRLNDILASNEDGVRQAVRGIAEVSKALEANKDGIGTVIRDIAELAASLKRISGKLEIAVDKVQSYVADEPGQISVVSEVKLAAASFRTLADKLDKSIGGEAENVTRQAKKSLAEAELFMRDSRRAAQNLDRLIDRIEKNPQSLLFGGATQPRYTPSQ